MTKLRTIVLGAAVVAGVVIPCVPASASTSAAPVACGGGNFGISPADSSNFIADIINAAFDVARVGIDAAQGIADTAVGAGFAPGARC